LALPAFKSSWSSLGEICYPVGAKDFELGDFKKILSKLKSLRTFSNNKTAIQL
jgi:hypothetical protein